MNASSYILGKFEKFINDNDLNFMLILSRSKGNVLDHLNGKKAWDQEFLDTLANKDYPVVDLQDYHQKEFEMYKGSPEEYLGKYYNGHYAPEGNFFSALSLRETMVDWLDDKPKPYRNK